MNDYITDGALQFLLNGYVPLGTLSDYATTSSLNTLEGRVMTVETKTSRLTYTSAMDLLTVSSGVTLSKTLSVNGTTADTISISCPNGKIMATNITITNKDDIEALQTKTCGFNADGTELTLTKLNGVSVSDYATTMDVGNLISNVLVLDAKTSGFNADGTELTLTKLNNLSMSDYVTTSSLNTLAGRVTTVETKRTGLSYSGGTTVFNAVPKIDNESLIDFFYLVGTIYQSSDNSFNPNTKWGGTWIKIEGRFILGSNSTKSVGDTGGADKVTIENRHLPDHTHSYAIHSCTFEETKIYNSVTDTTRLYANGAATSVGNTSGWRATSQVDQLDILPPYEVVNIWKRTA